MPPPTRLGTSHVFHVISSPLAWTTQSAVFQFCVSIRTEMTHKVAHSGSAQLQNRRQPLQRLRLTPNKDDEASGGLMLHKQALTDQSLRIQTGFGSDLCVCVCVRFETGPQEVTEEDVCDAS